MRYTNIVATEFGGTKDPNKSAYDNHQIDDDELGVALPYRFKNARPKVRVIKGNKSVICSIVDVGPWNTDDPYWERGDRPLVETQYERGERAQNGRIPTNKAAIDLTPGAARAIDLKGKGVVDFEFVADAPKQETKSLWQAFLAWLAGTKSSSAPAPGAPGNPLAVMRQITGTLEAPGSADNPTILGWAKYIGQKYPEMKAYCANYTHDSIAWCGLTMAYCMAASGIRPPYDPKNDLKSFLWVDAWATWGSPVARGDERPGDVLVFSSPHHVTMYEGSEGSNYVCRGGNQSDQVKVSRYAKSGIRAIRRPS